MRRSDLKLLEEIKRSRSTDKLHDKRHHGTPSKIRSRKQLPESGTRLSSTDVKQRHRLFEDGDQKNVMAARRLQFGEDTIAAVDKLANSHVSDSTGKNTSADQSNNNNTNDGKIYLHVMNINDGVDVVSRPDDPEARILYRVTKGNVITADYKKKIFGITYYKVSNNEGWLQGEEKQKKDKVLIKEESEDMMVPLVLLTDNFNATKRFDFERLERRTLSAQIVRLLIQCYGLGDARRVATETLQLAQNLEFMQSYTFDPTEYSDVYQDFLSAEGTPKRLSVFDLIPMMTKLTIDHSDPHMGLIDCCKQVLFIANMRPSEWGYKEWGFEGEYGSRVLILDDLTKQHRTDSFVAAAAAGRVKEVIRRIEEHQNIDAVHSLMGYNALHACADFGHVDVCKVLLDRGFTKNNMMEQTDSRYDQTPLHYAAVNGRLDVVRLLLDAGANRHAKAKNLLPRDVARIHKRWEVAVILKEPPGLVPGLRVTECSSKVVIVEWDEPEINPDEQAPLEYYELEHRMKMSTQSHIDNDKLTLTWRKLDLIDYDSTLMKHGGGRKYVFSDLLPASGHQFRIRCKNCCGWGPMSEEINQYTPGCEPTVPGRPLLVKTTRTSIMVEWIASKHKNGATISGYEIAYRRVGEDPADDPGAHLRFIFQEIDKDGGGTVERSEFMKSLKNFGFKLTPPQVNRLCDLLDEDGDGEINFKEFVDFCENSAHEVTERTETKDSETPAGNELTVITTEAVDPHNNNEGDAISDLNKIKSGEKFAAGDAELANVVRSELQRMSSGKVSASKSKWTITLFHALQYNAKEFPKLVVFGLYEFCIRCKNTYGWSGWSEIGGPYKLEDGLWVDEVTSRSVSIRWQKLVEIFPVVAYELQYREVVGKGASSTSEKDYKTISNTLKCQSYVIKDLKPAMAYNFRIRPCVATSAEFKEDLIHGEWRPWFFGIATPPIVTHTDKPDGVLGIELVETGVTHDSLEILWMQGNPNGNSIKECEICVREDVQRVLPDNIFSKGNMNRLVVRGLVPGSGYQFKIRSRNEKGWSDWCNWSDIWSTKGALPPGKPYVVKDNEGRRNKIGATDSSWIMCRWEPTAYDLGLPEKYEVQIQNFEPDEVGGGVWETWAVNEIKGESSEEVDCYAFLTNLKAATNYRIRVRCCTCWGWSIWSEPSDEILTLGRF